MGRVILYGVAIGFAAASVLNVQLTLNQILKELEATNHNVVEIFKEVRKP